MSEKKQQTELQKLHQQQMKEKRDALRKRKARTHRLIVRGAIAEGLLDDAQHMTDEQFKEQLSRALGKQELLNHPQTNPHGSDPR